MIGEIIETENWKGEKNSLKVIADIGAPEEISTERIEIISFPVPKKHSPYYGYFNCVDVRDYLDKADTYLGLHHTDALLKNAWRIPEEWKKQKLFFPGTILWGESKGPYMPYMYWGYEGWTLRFCAFFRMNWSIKDDRFIRWHR